MFDWKLFLSSVTVRDLVFVFVETAHRKEKHNNFGTKKKDLKS